jgi:hypothetical protein
VNTATQRVSHLGARIGGTAKQNPDDPQLPLLRRDLRAARAEDYIKRLVAAAPPLTEGQRARLAVLLLAPTLAPSIVDGEAA